MVAWPLPQDEVMLRPRTTSFMPQPRRGCAAVAAPPRPGPRAGRRCARPARGPAPRRRSPWRARRAEPGQVPRHLARRRAATRISRPGSRNCSTPVPGVGDQAGAGARGLEHPGRRREAVGRHAGAVDVEHRAGRAVEGVVVGGADMADVADVGRQRPVVPAGAAQQEAGLRQRLGGGEEELVDPRLAVGQPVAEEAELGREARVRRHRDGGWRGRARCRSARRPRRPGAGRRATTGSPPP